MDARRFTVRLLTPKANTKLVLGLDGTTNISMSAAKAIAIAASTAVDAILAMFFSAIEVRLLPRDRRSCRTVELTRRETTVLRTSCR